MLKYNKEILDPSPPLSFVLELFLARLHLRHELQNREVSETTASHEGSQDEGYLEVAVGAEGAALHVYASRLAIGILAHGTRHNLCNHQRKIR